MALYDSTYILSAFNRLALRPDTDEIADTTKYQWLTDAQQVVVADIAARCPWVLYGAPQTLTTADGGYTFTFGTDPDGFPIFPMGNVGIFTSLSAIPDCPWVEGVDYLSEGTLIRIPNNGTYAGTLYWRGITSPADISATSQPALFPEGSRELIAIEAARAFLLSIDRPDRAGDLQDQYNRNLPRWLLVWRRQFTNGGALAPRSGLQAAMLARPSA